MSEYASFDKVLRSLYFKRTILEDNSRIYNDLRHSELFQKLSKNKDVQCNGRYTTRIFVLMFTKTYISEAKRTH